MLLSTFPLDWGTVLTGVEDRGIGWYFVAFVNFDGWRLSGSCMELMLFIDSEVSSPVSFDRYSWYNVGIEGEMLDILIVDGCCIQIKICRN